MTKVPPIFYKYRSMAGDARLHVRDTILRNRIYVASPSSFNDPFDCTPAFAPSFSEQGVLALARRRISRDRPSLPPEEVEKRAIDFVRQTRDADMAIVAVGLREGQEVLRQQLAVYSVSATCKNPLMWSHYADSHRGICLGFSSDIHPFNLAQPVEYSYVRHPLDPIHDEDAAKLQKALLLKSSDWKYEKEWRFIDWMSGPGVVEIPADGLVRIILGARISWMEENRIKEWIEERHARIEIRRAAISANHFEVDVVPDDGRHRAWWT